MQLATIEWVEILTCQLLVLNPYPFTFTCQVFEIFPNDQRLLVKLPSCWKPDDVVTAYYQAPVWSTCRMFQDASGIFRRETLLKLSQVPICHVWCSVGEPNLLEIYCRFTRSAQADHNGILQPLTSPAGPLGFFTWQCMSEGLAVPLPQQR